MSQILDTVISDDPDEQNDLLIRVFNSGDGELYDALYTPDAISNMSGGPLTGEARSAFFKEFLAAGAKITSKVVQSYTTGDTSLLIVDYVMTLPGPDGRPSPRPAPARTW